MDANHSMDYYEDNWSSGPDIHGNTYAERMVFAIGCTVLFFTGAMFSGMFVFVTYYGKMYKNRVNLLVANAALGDLFMDMLDLACQPINMISRNKNYACDWLTYFTGMESNWFVSVIAVNRYVSIFHQALFKKVYTGRNIILMLIAGWLVPFVFTLPFHIFGRTGIEDQYMHCGIITDTIFWELLNWALIITPTFLADCVTIYCNVKIFRRLREHATNASTLQTNMWVSGK